MLGVKDGRAAKIPVRVGIRGNSHVEIVAGLSAVDVAVPQSSGVVTGQRFRAVLP